MQAPRRSLRLAADRRHCPVCVCATDSCLPVFDPAASPARAGALSSFFFLSAVEYPAGFPLPLPPSLPLPFFRNSLPPLASFLFLLFSSSTHAPTLHPRHASPWVTCPCAAIKHKTSLHANPRSIVGAGNRTLHGALPHEGSCFPTKPAGGQPRRLFSLVLLVSFGVRSRSSVSRPTLIFARWFACCLCVLFLPFHLPTKKNTALTTHLSALRPLFFLCLRLLDPTHTHRT